MKCMICGRELEGDKESIYITDYGYMHIDCIKDMLEDYDKRKRPIKYNRLLEIIDKLHLWIFLHVADESEVYKEIGLTDEENHALGYCSNHVKINKKDRRDINIPIIDLDDEKMVNNMLNIVKDIKNKLDNENDINKEDK